MTYPVCAITKIWMSDPIAAANYQSRVGVNTYELQWKALKPFPDAPIYIAGDSFVPSIKSVGAFIGWSEGSLLNSERILVNHFGLAPYSTDVPMTNEFLNTSKL
ncbi:hypothetical protein EB796_000179 [Bugula neritina]|uniref:Uncharacterized protein n=1 Tax=Bugula neritina TaxID=10212 RepID=A0A7J7KTG0_BUGNE|nr:hypothetical protein EB796_000179 [Bugula neritina]